MMIPLLAAWLALAQGVAAASPTLIFRADFDGTVAPQVGQGEPIITGGQATFVPGKRGQAYVADGSTVLAYPAEGNLLKPRGTACLWVCQQWDGDDGQNHGFLADDLDFNDPPQNNLYLWKWVSGPNLRLDLRSADLVDAEYRVAEWRAGEWHHIAAAWDCEQGVWLFADGNLVAARQYTWEPKAGTRLYVGANCQGQAPANALLDELRIFDAALEAGHIRRVMEGQALPVLTPTAVTAPKSIKPGRPFRVTVSFDAATDADPPTFGVKLAEAPLDRVSAGAQPPIKAGANTYRGLEFVMPAWYRLPPGEQTLTVTVEGAWIEQPDAWRKKLRVKEARPMASRRQWTIQEDGSVLLNGEPYLSPEPDQAFWFEGQVRPYDDAGRTRCRDLVRSGQIADAIPCRRLDTVDCTETDHDFREWGQSRLAELADGRQYRLTGTEDSVTETREVYGSDRKVLPGFAYQLRTEPRATPHLLVVETLNDRERYLETAIDAVASVGASPLLREAGIGSADLANLNVTYTGREYETDNQPFQQVTLFFPKTGRIEVTITSSDRGQLRDEASGAAVRSLAVYEVTRPLTDLAAEPDPPKGEQRTVSLFYPWCSPLWNEYGSSGANETTRAASAACLMEYLRFIGFNRLEFHPYQFGRKAEFDSKLFPNGGQGDVFKEILPIAERCAVQVVPRVDSLCFHFEGEEFEKTPEIFQLTRKGEMMDFFGNVPDPLHPTVQQLMYDMLREMAEKTRGLSCVPAVGFRANGKFGNLYVGINRAHPPEESGYSEFDIAEFAKGTGTSVGGTTGDAGSRYDWLRENAWDAWIQWRCRRVQAHWERCRDMVQEVDPDKELIVFTKIPSNDPGEKRDWEDAPLDLLTLHKYHGYDPALFTGEQGIALSRVMGVDADRYWPQPWNKTFFFEPELSGFFRSGEASGVELYYIYWELPTHPKGFRVGPASPLGRAYYEPMTHAIRTQNPGHFTFYNWFRATMGHEQDLRGFCRAFRSLPMAEPAPFRGAILPEGAAADRRLWVRQFGDRIAVVNDSAKAREVTLALPPGYAQDALRDVALNVRCEVTKEDGQRLVRLSLRPWDLRTLVPGPAGARHGEGT